jgi:hypothetical protein
MFFYKYKYNMINIYYNEHQTKNKEECNWKKTGYT